MDGITFKEARMETGQLIIDIPVNSRGKVMNWLRSRKDMCYDLSIKEHRKKRSLDANAYAWVLIGKLADAMRITPKEVYRQAIVNIGGNYEVLPVRDEAVAKFKEVWEAQGQGWPCYDLGKSKHDGYRNLKCYYGSSSYDVRQMTQLIDNLVQDCKALGIETMTPEQLSLLTEAWHEKGH